MLLDAYTRRWQKAAVGIRLIVGGLQVAVGLWFVFGNPALGFGSKVGRFLGTDPAFAASSMILFRLSGLPTTADEGYGLLAIYGMMVSLIVIASTWGHRWTKITAPLLLGFLTLYGLLVVVVTRLRELETVASLIFGVVDLVTVAAIVRIKGKLLTSSEVDTSED